MAYGLIGAKFVPSLLRSLASIYWFAFQTVAGSLALVAVLDRWTGTHFPLIGVSLVFAMPQAIVAIIGYDSLKQLSRLALPLKLGILGYALWVMTAHPDPHFAPGAVLGHVPNMFQVVAGLSQGWLPLLALVVVIVLDNWTINVLNLYTGGLSLANIFERLGRFWTTLIISVLGIGLSAVPDVVHGYTGYVGLLGNVFSPIAGVLVADYLFVKRMRIDMVGLFERDGPYWYWRGWNPVAVVWTVLGFLLYMFVIPQPWVQTLCTLIVTAAGYWASTRLLALRWRLLARGARPGDQRESVEALVWDLASRKLS